MTTLSSTFIKGDEMRLLKGRPAGRGRRVAKLLPLALMLAGLAVAVPAAGGAAGARTATAGANPDGSYTMTAQRWA